MGIQGLSTEQSKNRPRLTSWATSQSPSDQFLDKAGTAFKAICGKCLYAGEVFLWTFLGVNNELLRRTLVPVVSVGLISLAAWAGNAAMHNGGSNEVPTAQPGVSVPIDAREGVSPDLGTPYQDGVLCLNRVVQAVVGPENTNYRRDTTTTANSYAGTAVAGTPVSVDGCIESEGRVWANVTFREEAGAQPAMFFIRQPGTEDTAQAVTVVPQGNFFMDAELLTVVK